VGEDVPPRFFVRCDLGFVAAAACPSVLMGVSVDTRSEIAEGLERRLDALGFECVEIRWGGTARRPVLRLRIDRAVPTGAGGVTVEDCARVSREMEPWLDAHPELSERYTLEVSSPGVDRPLVRPRDFERFRGARVVLSGNEALFGEQRRLEGELLGWEDSEPGRGRVRLRLSGGDEVDVPMERIQKANLVFTWK